MWALRAMMGRVSVLFMRRVVIFRPGKLGEAVRIRWEVVLVLLLMAV